MAVARRALVQTWDASALPFHPALSGAKADRQPCVPPPTVTAGHGLTRQASFSCRLHCHPISCDRLYQGLVYCLVEPNHVLDPVLVECFVLKPEGEHTGAQRSIFGDHLIHGEACHQTYHRMCLGRCLAGYLRPLPCAFQTVDGLSESFACLGRPCAGSSRRDSSNRSHPDLAAASPPNARNPPRLGESAPCCPR